MVNDVEHDTCSQHCTSFI